LIAWYTKFERSYAFQAAAMAKKFANVPQVRDDLIDTLTTT
jgi:hypothetical protein